MHLKSSLEKSPKFGTGMWSTSDIIYKHDTLIYFLFHTHDL